MIEAEVKYKKTGIDWMPEVPEHWKSMRLKFISNVKFSTVDKHLHKEEKKVRLCNYVDVYKNEYITNNLEFMEASASDEEIVKFSIKKGDIILTKDSETFNDIAVPAFVIEDIENLVCGYHLAQVRANDSIIDSNFLFRVLQSRVVNHHFTIAAKGVTRCGLSFDDISSVFIPFPETIEEQREIAKHLESESAKITRFVQTKQRFISLLKEQRQGIVNNIVTKGIDNESNLVDSGFDWLGSIPNHWKMIRVKNVFELVTEQAPEGNNEVLLSIYSAIGVKPRKDMEQRGNKSTTTDGYWKVKQGDIIVNKLLAWMGAIGISEYEGVTSPAYDILRLKIDGNPFYYSELFRNSNIRGEFKKYSKGIMDVRLRLYFSEFGKIFIPVFPKDEQDKIVGHIKAETKTLDIAISKAEREIELIKEYREAMIAEAVTGKMKL